MSILAVGSVAFDTLETPFGHAEGELGGALSYFALAASHFDAVRMVAVVGQDFGPEQEAVFRDRPIDLAGLERVPGKTFTWGGRYGYDLNERTTLFTHLNVFEDFHPKLPPAYRASEYLFLGNIDPSLQREVLEQVEGVRLVAADTMNYWMTHTHESLLETLKHVDALLINDSEARQLAGVPNLMQAAELIHGLGPKILVIKKGEHGALLFDGEEHFAAPAFLLGMVRDPTGAGDAFAGGFLGHLAAVDRIDSAALRQAVVFGSVLASFTVEDFGVRRLRSLTRQEIDARFRAFERQTRFEPLP
ncbi:MAG TPA: PfkB family carbohydrate kinase [Acidobacteriota bacterium]